MTAGYWIRYKYRTVKESLRRLVWRCCQPFQRYVSTELIAAFALLLVGLFLALLFDRRVGFDALGVLTEFHGFLLDLFVFGILITIFQLIRHRREEIKRYLEEIDDYRNWDEKEASFRIAGNLRRLARLDATRGTDLSHCHLVGARLGGPDAGLRPDLSNANFWSANLSGAIIAESTVFQADFEQATCERINLMSTDCREATFNECNLTQAQFDSANCSEADFLNATLEGAKGRDVNFNDAYFYGASLVDAEFTRSMFLGTVMTNCNCRGAYFAGSGFVRARLTASDFTNATFTSANLGGANLYNSKFENTNFANAVLVEADFRLADLRGARNLTVEQLCETATLYQAKLDPELEAQVRQVCPHKLEKPEESRLQKKWREKQEESQQRSDKTKTVG